VYVCVSAEDDTRRYLCQQRVMNWKNIDPHNPLVEIYIHLGWGFKN